MKKMVSIILVIIGTMIGAGFASGKEIDLFFFQYQKNGIYGLMLATTLLGIIIYMVFRLVDREKIDSYEKFLKKICGFGKRKNNILFYSIKFIINSFLLISFYIMIAGFGAYFEQELNTNKIIGIVIISILCYFLFKKQANGLIKVNTILVPILIICILYLGLQNTYNYGNSSFTDINTKQNWILSSLIYSSYNSIILIPILITLKNKKVKRKQSLLISILCVVLLFLLGIIIYFLLFNVNTTQNIEIPVMLIASKFHPICRYLFGFILLISIFTSCLSCGYAFLENFQEKQYEKMNKIICFSSIFIAPIGFSNLVYRLYPIFGFLGLIQLILILKENCKRF